MKWDGEMKALAGAMVLTGAAHEIMETIGMDGLSRLFGNVMLVAFIFSYVLYFAARRNR